MADILLRKAGQDETALRKFAEDTDIADDILGLHAQQAAEKYMKAVLTANQIPFERVHDLAALFGLLEDAGVDAPEWLGDTIPLSPYAAAIRYEQDIDRALDRPGTVTLIERVRAWAEEQVVLG